MFEQFGQTECKLKLHGREIKARQIILPMPPSENKRLELDYVGTKLFLANKYKGAKSNKRGVLRNSTEYNQWISAAANALKKGKYPKITEGVTCFIEVVFPDRHRRDVQNRAKAFFDALTASGHVFEDDCQVELFSMHRTIITGSSFILAYLMPSSELPGVDIKLPEEFVQKIAEQVQ